MVILLALLAAGANAVAIVLQRIGVEEVMRDENAKNLLASVIRRRVWFVGLTLMTAGFLLQALALSMGDLSEVQPVMVTEILFLLAILGFWLHQSLGWREWLGASGTAVGLGAFLFVASPTGGTKQPLREDWIWLLIASVGAIGLGLIGGSRGPRAWRAACYGIAAAVSFALTAALVKTVADEWGRGVVYTFSHLPAYGVAVAGLMGLVISQHALGAGPIAVSQSAMLIVNPLASIVMGIWLFSDSLKTSSPREVLEAIALVVMFCGLVTLSHSPLINPPSGDEHLLDRYESQPLRAGGATS